MAIKELTPEQVRTWSDEKKDRWWFEHVYRGDMPQLTWRSSLTGMGIGGALSLTNLYVGAKTGWTLGVGITSVILAYTAWKILEKARLASNFTILENNCMQSIATAAGYMTGALVSSLPAYMMVTGKIIPMWTALVWVASLSVLGVLFAFPLKRRFINYDQLPFPEGRAAGVVMDALHEGDASEGVFKGKIMAWCAGLAALAKFLQSEAIMGHAALLTKMDEFFVKVAALRINGVPLRELSVHPDTDFVMMAAGGLMGIRIGVSLMIGAVINYMVLAPWMIGRGDIHEKIVKGVVQHGQYGFKTITMWALWGGVAMMTTAALFSFFSRPQIIISAFRGMFRKREGEDVLRDIELPMSVFVVGIPVFGVLTVFLAHQFFGVNIWMGALAVPLVFVFTLIAANATGLTSITPTGALGKLTQLTYGALAPGNVTTNLATAAITGEVSSNAANLLMDIKPGFMLGGKPRQQACGHVLGIIAGSLVSVPVFYLVFLHNGIDKLVTETYPFPGAVIWKAVAELLTTGLSNLAVSARWAALVGALLGIAMEAAKVATKGRFWLSGVGVALACVIPFNTCLAMFLGSFLFWLAKRRFTDEKSGAHKVFVANMEPTAAGIIAGGAIMGIAIIIIETFVLK